MYSTGQHCKRILLLYLEYFVVERLRVAVCLQALERDI